LQQDRTERRLAAILAADVVGYSRLMGVDEEGTLRQLKLLRKELVDPKIIEHRGRIVKTTGDGLLVEFASVIDAVRCAVEVQRAMIECHGDVSEEQRMMFRVGINVGDIIIDGDDIFGDGVNIAARLESLAEPGGICVSRSVYEHVRDKLNFGLEDTGEQAVKNIARPVGTYRIVLDGIDAPDRGVVLIADSALAKAPIGVISGGQASASPLAGAIDKGPDRLSIAVLPLENLSGDKEQEYFADGISEDIITGLSNLRGFLVIARNSSFTFRGKSVDVKQIARELGVRYLLEGSVRKGGNRVRITVQLIDASSGTHLWAERYDRDLSDIFAVQDEIRERVVAAIEPQIYAAEGSRLQAPNPESLDAWDCVLKGLSYTWRGTGEDSVQAQALFRRAIALSPTYARPYGLLAWTMVWGAFMGWVPVTDALIEEAQSLTEMARARDDLDAWSHLATGLFACYRRKTEDAERSLRRALDLNSNFSLAYSVLGMTYAYAARAEDSRKAFDRANRMNPTDPANAVTPAWYSVALFTEGRYEEALQTAMETVRLRPDWVGAHRVVLLATAQLGRLDEARAALATVKRLQPTVSLAWARNYVPFTRKTDRQKYVESFRLAGLME
jgi:TolB-like protein/class 3 adenylate cyclase/Flp pilus assembly protein TadD